MTSLSITASSQQLMKLPVVDALAFKRVIKALLFKRTLMTQSRASTHILLNYNSDFCI